MGPRKTTFAKKDCMTPQAMNDDKRLACARLSYSIVDVLKIRRERLGKRGGGGGENGRESPVSPQPPRVFRVSFYTFLTVSTERRFTTILGAWNRLPFVQISSIY